MRTAIGRVSARGQVTIPRRIRDEIGIQPGDDLWISVEDSKVVLRRVDLSIRAGYGSIPGIGRPITGDEIDEIAEIEAVKDYLESVSRED